YPWLEQFVANYLSAPVTLLAGVALQIYLTHDFILRQDALREIPFPVNIMVFCVATLALSVLFEKLSLRPRKKRQRLKEPSQDV
ncbi:hypothetical protein ACSTLX_25345, partial [Vibrio parahaemolyticus]